MNPADEEQAIFDELFAELLIQQSKPRSHDDRAFWLAVWAAADASRAYRKRAAEWRDAGFADWAGELESAADDHDRRWDAKIKAHRNA